jgi:hypothetical protein
MSTSFDMPGGGASFEDRGGWVVKALAAEFGLTLAQSAGIVGNLGYESGGFKTLQEISPLVSGSAGGYGWAQWTGPRRTSFMTWCSAHSLKPSSDEANYGYLVVELSRVYHGTIDAVKRTATLDDAVFSVGQTYERPGGTTADHLPGFADRLVYAKRALAGAGSTAIAGPILNDAGKVGEDTVSDLDDDIAQTIDLLQTQLQRAGFYHGGIDSDPGPLTLAAITAWRNA